MLAVLEVIRSSVKSASIGNYRTVPSLGNALSAVIYASLLTDRKLSNSEITSITDKSALLFKVLDLADIIVDSSLIKDADKTPYYQKIQKAIIQGEVFTPETKEENFLLDMCLQFRTGLSKEILLKIETSLVEAIRADEEQKVCNIPSRLLELAEIVGSACSRITYDIAAFYTNTENLKLKKVAEAIGAYSQLLDTYQDLDDDLKMGVKTYATEMIQLLGDNKKNREKIRLTLLKNANSIYQCAFKEVATYPKIFLFKLDFIRKAIATKYFSAFISLYKEPNRKKNSLIDQFDHQNVDEGTLARLRSPKCGSCFARVYHGELSKQLINAASFAPDYTSILNNLIIVQRRVGLGGRPIFVYKIRTMPLNSKPKVSSDTKGIKPKNTELNSFQKVLRRFGLDEAPQFLNILKGDLKLVGIRPLPYAEFHVLPKEMQEKIIKVKPGLAGIRYAFSEPKDRMDAARMDQEYIDQYLQNPYKTDFIYLCKIIYQAVFLSRRSS